MSYGDTFIAGFNATRSIREKKLDRELRQEALDREMLQAAAARSLQRELDAKNDPLRAANVGRLNAETARTTALTPAEVAESTARARNTNATASRTETLTPYEAAHIEASTRGANASAQRVETMTPLEAAEQDLINQTRSRAASAGPMASVKQPIGDGAEATFQIPLAEAQKAARSAAYVSPYADKIAQLGGRAAENQAALDAGDTRTGFLNLRSREEDATKANRQLTRLKALEIQDMLQKGHIDEAEADRRAAKLLSFR